MDDKPVRVKEEHCENEGEEGEIRKRREFAVQETMTTAAVGVKREMEGMVKKEKEDEIVRDEDEENARRTGDERRSNKRERKYACDICRKMFTRPWLLKNHERTHTIKKPFKCGKCGNI